jgi:hypothetical protein
VAFLIWHCSPARRPSAGADRLSADEAESNYRLQGDILQVGEDGPEVAALGSFGRNMPARPTKLGSMNAKVEAKLEFPSKQRLPAPSWLE